MKPQFTVFLGGHEKEQWIGEVIDVGPNTEPNFEALFSDVMYEI
jgi:hypothetical protein